MGIEAIFDARHRMVTNAGSLRCDDPDYLEAVTALELGEINPDVVLLNYESAVKENAYLERHYPDFANRFWIVAQSGQGDSWLWSSERHCMAWFDHDQGEFDPLGVRLLPLSFKKFVELGLVVRDFESQVDAEEQFFAVPANVAAYEAALEGIAPGLASQYPYRYYEA